MLHTSEKKTSQLVDHFFRHESGRMIAVLTRIFGAQNIEIAEDIVQDTLLEALTRWQYESIPENPRAWLYKVAKNKSLNLLNREKYKHRYSLAATEWLEAEQNNSDISIQFFSETEIDDDQLRMIFTCCHPAISPDSQIALALKTLCGFSIPEIAKAFITTEENINKRLVRARQKIRENKIPFSVPSGPELDVRLNTVLETIYLLFNEGYSASKGDQIIRFEVCEEAIRLTQMIVSNNSIKKKGDSYALLSLLTLNASRFNARINTDGNLLTLEEQDRTLWNIELKDLGFHYLELSMQHNSVSLYHILATISAHYSIADNFDSINWNEILSLYNSLILLDNSPLVLLNRAIVLAKIEGYEKALAELEIIKIHSALTSYHLFYSTQAEFYIQINQFEKAKQNLLKAIELAPLKSEKKLLESKLQKIIQ